MVKANTDARNGSILPVLAVMGIALALRLYQLGTESLWIDEGYSLRDAASSLSLLDTRPLYYNLLHQWMQFGQSEEWLRMLSVVFGVLTVLMVYLVGDRLFGRTTGTIAALLVAVSPLHVNHSQEVRMYSLLTFMVTAGVLLFLRYIETGRFRTLVGVVALGFMSFLIFPPAVFMFLTYTVYLLMNFRRHRKPAIWWLGAQCLSGIALIPWAPRLLEVSKSYGDAWTWRLAKPGLLDFVWLFRDFCVWRIAPSHKTALMVANVYAVAVLGLVIYGAFHGLKQYGWQTKFTLTWLLVPLVLTSILSNTLANVWITRYMIYASPALYLLTGLGLSRLTPRRMLFSVALMGVLLLPLGRLAVYYKQPERPEWRQAVEYIEDRLQPGDSIALYRSGNRYVFDYYYDGKTPVFALGDESLARDAFLGWTDTRITKLLSGIPKNTRRVWFVFSFHEETGGVAIEDYVRRHYHVLGLKEFERIRIFEALPQQQSKRGTDDIEH